MGTPWQPMSHHGSTSRLPLDARALSTGPTPSGGAGSRFGTGSAGYSILGTSGGQHDGAIRSIAMGATGISASSGFEGIMEFAAGDDVPLDSLDLVCFRYLWLGADQRRRGMCMFGHTCQVQSEACACTFLFRTVQHAMPLATDFV